MTQNLFDSENNHLINVIYNQLDDNNIAKITLYYTDEQRIEALINLLDTNKVEIIYNNLPNNSDTDYYKNMIYMIINSHIFEYFHYYTQ